MIFKDSFCTINFLKPLQRISEASYLIQQKTM